MDESGLARIRLVTRRYRELQGLHGFATMAVLIGSFWAQPYLRLLGQLGKWEATAAFVLMAVPWMSIAAAHALLSQYYARRFGHVAVDPGLASYRDQIAWAVLLGAGAWLDLARVPSTPPIAALAAGAGIALHITVRDWPFRAYHIAVAAVCAVGAVLIAAGVVVVRNADELLQRPISLMLAAQLIASALDHHLLSRTLFLHPDARAESLVTDHADAL